MKSYNRSPRAKNHPHYEHLKPLFDEISKIESNMVKVCLIFEDDLNNVDIPRPCIVVTRLSDSPRSLRDTMWWSNVGKKHELLIDRQVLPLNDKGRAAAVVNFREELVGYINADPS